jgi:site-specific DNA-methyltransferase (adenine-specific)
MWAIEAWQMPKPYYEDSAVIIYHGDCREIVPSIPEIDLVLTDPPYPNMKGVVSNYFQTPIKFLERLNCRQFIFWPAKGDFPLSFSAVHIWDKKTGCQSEYERIFERNSDNDHWRVFSQYLINSAMAARYTGDVFTGHPSQKPIKLIQRLLEIALRSKSILDPFMGSGTTLRAAKDLGRKAIGIEIEERYCEIATKRMAQDVLDLQF